MSNNSKDQNQEQEPVELDRRQVWECTYSYLTRFPKIFIAADVEELCRQLQERADRKPVNRRLKPVGELSFEVYTDEVHASFKRGQKTIRFANLQFRG